jgi:hypothetical protein
MELGVYRHRNQPGMPAGKQRFEVLGAILHDQRDALTALQTKARPQRLRQTTDAVGEHAVAVHDGGAARDARSGSEGTAGAAHVGGDVQTVRLNVAGRI